ncbi:MAG: nucleotidyl transferase AbiEii/AbiGii toxin family protein [Bacteroidetes bacterium]|nr:nucleotidyl transferase AbiEii/AbiGii toxin family protein [Bacteroidota bacterium]
MLQKSAVSAELYQTLVKLMELDLLHDHRLVGGTALALQIGHRLSVDIDLFSDQKHNYEQITNTLAKKFNGNLNIIRSNTDGITLFINTIKTDIYDWDVPFNHIPFIENNIRMAYKKDIIPMKLNTFCSSHDARYEKKDYTDIAALLREYSLSTMIDLYFHKYTQSYLNERIIIERLGHYTKAESNGSTMPIMLDGSTWDDVKKQIDKSINSYINENMNE